MRKP
jgi:hypothetical protein